MLYVAALVAGLSLPLGWGLGLPDWAAIAWKGAGVGLLAIWASRLGRSTDHRLLVLVLLLGSIADMVLELAFIAGAMIFALGHVVAITLYARHRRSGLGARDVALAGLFTGGAMLLAAHLASVDMAAPVAVYTLFLAAMAAMALLSRFPLAAAGALLFTLSDLLIFARMESLSGASWVGHAIWWLYFAGQALIARGVGTALGGAVVLDSGHVRR
ncbi:lysoplasmalogenase family protein [Sandaracinobacteroides sp. A072]|uniref:lysoplasmalogenase family protein n=1 Tax=Sandaracinobacteroides sp. A072 TaxID=3461146 RepID=UPI00404380D7